MFLGSGKAKCSWRCWYSCQLQCPSFGQGSDAFVLVDVSTQSRFAFWICVFRTTSRLMFPLCRAQRMSLSSFPGDPTVGHIISTKSSDPTSSDPTKCTGDQGSLLAIVSPLLEPLMTTLSNASTLISNRRRMSQRCLLDTPIRGQASKFSLSVLKPGASTFKDPSFFAHMPSLHDRY